MAHIFLFSSRKLSRWHTIIKQNLSLNSSSFNATILLCLTFTEPKKTNE